MIKEAMLYEPAKDGRVHCFLCNHHCRIADSKFGFCGVRRNQKGTLVTYAYGRVIAAGVDPIEKKPLYHFLPGSLSFSIATAGCNFHCGFCQNWQISQISEKEAQGMPGREFSPREIVEQAKETRCRSIAYTYTEPTIFFEYAYDVAGLAKKEGLYNVFVTNGFMTAEALNTIHPYLDACNVDLKSFRDEFYKKTCRGRLKPVLESIRHMRQLGIWVEVTTLVVPDQNDSEAELGEIAHFIAGIDQGMPWHISRFHPDYEFGNFRPTPIETLRKAYSIGKEAGLEHVYIGNVPGAESDTVCPRCQQIVIRRRAFAVEENRLEDSRCPTCGSLISGVFA
jgi:pyruvate formate lyase activating enzyme